MRGKLMLVVVGVLFFGLMVADVQAFCVYNYTDREVIVEQLDGGVPFKAFKQTIQPNGYACCNWTNNDCNTSGKRDGRVKFDVYYFTGEKNFGIIPKTQAICYIEILAGGWLEVTGKDGKYECKGYYDP